MYFIYATPYYKEKPSFGRICLAKYQVMKENGL